MRTRIYNKMTSQEVEDYLTRGGDTIFIAIGVVECHGNMPIDCETIGPEANAVLLAEKADGLAMINLPYFYPGGTVISNATVHLSIADCIDYLKKICYSLVDQGFKRLFLTSGHAPSSLYIDAFCRDFFEETLIHPCHISNLRGKPMWGAGGFDAEDFRKFGLTTYGAYKVMGQMEYLPIDPDATVDHGPRMENDPALENFTKYVRPYGGVASLVFSDAAQHGGGMVFRSEEERLAACTEGEKYLREMVDACPINEYKEALADYQAYVKRVYQKYPRIQKVR